MARNILFWILALLITLSSAVYQRKTGPTYPVDGQAEVGEVMVFYSLTRSHGGDGDQPIRVRTERDGMVFGTLIYRRYKTDDPWTRVPMEAQGDTLTAWLPHQPPAGKLEYFLELEPASAGGADEAVRRIPAQETVVTRFKGAVPNGVLIPHVIFMFLAMLFSTRTGIEALRKKGRPRMYVFITTALLIVGGLILGPIVQKYAFGEYWTGFPWGMDLTDNKTLIAFIAWLVAIFAVWNRKSLEDHPVRRWIVLGAAVVMMLVYLIPHSMMGSELNYEELDRQRHEQALPSAETEPVSGVPASEAPGTGMEDAPPAGEIQPEDIPASDRMQDGGDGDRRAQQNAPGQPGQ